MKHKCIVILPAYNEEESLALLLDECGAVLPALGNYEIILINDGSTDATVEIAERYSEKLNLLVVHHSRNKGLGPAIKTGLHISLERSESDNDTVIYMDADYTHPPRYIPHMEDVIEQGADVVIASRFLKGSREVGVPFLRRLYSRGARIVFKLFLPLPGVTDYTCGYRAYRLGLIRRALQRYGDTIIERTGFACTDEILVNLATFDIRIEEIPFVLRYDRKRGKSKLPLGLTIIETLRMLVRARKKLKKQKVPL